MRECKCKTCEYMFQYFTQGAHPKRKAVWCKGDEEYIEKYFNEHKINKAKGFIGFHNVYKKDFPVTKTPKWCPLNAIKHEGLK